MTNRSGRRSRILRNTLRLAVLAFALLSLIIAVNAIRFSSQQIKVAPVDPVSVDPAVFQRLSAAVSMPTVSYRDRIDTSAFLQLDTLIRNDFPLVDSLLEKMAVTSYSQVRYWRGLESAMPPILLMGHLDVVPVETEALDSWTYPPFSGAIADGFIWGRGTLDDKVTVFAILEAIEQLLSEGYTPNRSIYLAFGHDEEVSGLDGAQTIADYFATQNIRFEYVLDEGQIILDNALAGLASPVAMIGIAEKGYLTLDLEVKLEEGGHSSMPPPVTAVGLLARSLDRLQQAPFPARIDGATRQFLDFVGPEMSPLYQVLFSNLWLTEPLLIRQLEGGTASNAIIRTTTAPTVIQGGVRANVLPTQAAAQVNFRILPGETVESVQAYVEKTIDDARVTVRIPNDNWQSDPSPVSGIKTFGFGVIQKSIKEVFPDVVVAPALVIGATDSRHYQEVSDQIYRFLPLLLDRADLSRIHGIDERVSESAYANAIRFYRQLIRNSTN